MSLSRKIRRAHCSRLRKTSLQEGWLIPRASQGRAEGKARQTMEELSKVETDVKCTYTIRGPAGATAIRILTNENSKTYEVEGKKEAFSNLDCC